jgi:hypothetical protein
VSLDYEDDRRSRSSETRSVVEEEVKALLQVGGWGQRVAKQDCNFVSGPAMIAGLEH